MYGIFTYMWLIFYGKFREIYQSHGWYGKTFGRIFVLRFWLVTSYDCRIQSGFSGDFLVVSILYLQQLVGNNQLS